MEILFTKEPKWLDKWDAFLNSNDIGSHLQLSDWLSSYTFYGFDFEVCICIDNDKIIGGFGAVIAKMSLFKFYIVSYGPIVVNSSTLLNDLILKVELRAKELKTCYCQINLPITKKSSEINDFYNSSLILDNLQSFKSGQLFKYVFPLNGYNWLSLTNYNEPESLLVDFKSSVRRDIRSSIRKELEVRFLKSEKDIKEAYDLCLENASIANYSIRDWNGFKNTILNLIEKGHAKFIAAYKGNEIKGAILLIKSGNFYTYILGGTKKEKPDLLVGHFLQWEAIKLSIDEKCRGYNISLGGSKGVKEFKSSFATEAILFENGKYYKVMNSFLFLFFNLSNRYLKPYKNSIAKILAFFKK
jgi:lipid II:glycine glycyltransferase (peptidoglycan interpeptide bridge formation enzyme)